VESRPSTAARPVDPERRLRLLRPIAPLLVVLVGVGLMAAATVGMLTLVHRLDQERVAQVNLARVSHLVDSVRYQPTFSFASGIMKPADVAAYRALAADLRANAQSLAALSPSIGEPILSAVEDLERTMSQEVQKLQQGDVRTAEALDASKAVTQYARLGSDAASGPTTSPGLLVPADRELAWHVDRSRSDINLALIIDVLGTGVLVIVFVSGAAMVRRRQALRRADEAARSDAAGYLAALTSNSSDLIIVTDEAGVVTYASPGGKDVLGIPPEDLVGTAARELVHVDDRPLTARYLAAFVGREMMNAVERVRVRHHDGAYRLVELSMANLLDNSVVGGIVLNARDITERTEMETQLLHAQKLDSIGQLASGIAHEINTPIQFIGDNVRFLGDAFETLAKPAEQVGAADAEYLSAEVPLAIGQTLDGIDRVATIVRAMKAFGHPGTDEKTPTDVNEAVRNTLVVTNTTIKHVADVSVDLGELPRVWCHPGDINQVLVNLVVNAAHAIADAGDGRRGTITVRTCLDGSTAVITVTDTGCGMTQQVAARVFEPFFTTKEVGRGTGQGLSLAYTLVVKRHGGSINLTSQPGQGTTFTVRLPVDADRTSADQAESLPAEDDRCTA
jgi:PAS domain S-box-containing protein